MAEHIENMAKTEALAKLFGVSVRRIQQLTQDGLISTTEIKVRGKNARRYDLSETIPCYVKYLNDKLANREKPGGLEEEKLQEEVNLKRSKARIAQLQLEEIEGGMHSAEDIEKITTDLVLAIRSALLALPGRLAVDVAETTDAAEAEGIIKNTICDILEELSRYHYDPQKYKERVRERQKWMKEYGESAE